MAHLIGVRHVCFTEIECAHLVCGLVVCVVCVVCVVNGVMIGWQLTRRIDWFGWCCLFVV